MIAQQKMKVKLTGIAAYIPHNGNLSDPLHPLSKQLKVVSSKKKKTEDDYKEMARIEHYASLYLNDDKQCIIPDVNLEALICEGAKMSKLGKEVKAGVVVEESALLIHDGPKTPEGLFANKEFNLRVSVKVGTARVMRTRPRFKNWGVIFEITYYPETIDKDKIVEALVNAGQFKGLGDWRPRFGRFTVEVL